MQSTDLSLFFLLHSYQVQILNYLKRNYGRSLGNQELSLGTTIMDQYYVECSRYECDKSYYGQELLTILDNELESHNGFMKLLLIRGSGLLL